MRRAVLLTLVLAGVVPTSAPPAWTWPADGPVLRPFVFGSDPCAAGQHRGIDVAGDLGTTVSAPPRPASSRLPAPCQGRQALSIRTPDGYTVWLQHLGTISVRKGDAVSEAAVATVGRVESQKKPSRTSISASG